MAMEPLRSLMQLRKPAWPDPEDSVGKEFGEIPKTKLSYWEATGPAQTAYQKLLPEVLNVLAEKQGPIPNSDFVWFSLYMVGSSPSTAAPFIIFASEQRSQRRTAMNYIKSSKILEAYPGMRVGEWAEAPHIGRQEQKGSSRESVYGGLQIPDRITADSPISIGFQVSTVLSFHYPDRISKATASVVVNIDDVRHYLVPSHVLLSPRSAVAAKDESPRDSDNEGFDFGDLMEDDYLSEDDYLVTSLGSISSTSTVSPDPERQSLIRDSTESSMNSHSGPSKTTAQHTLMTHLSNQGEGNVHRTEAGTNCPVVSIDLDYALCRVAYNDAKASSNSLPVLPSTMGNLAEPSEYGTPVQALTVHGLLKGRLSRTRTHVHLPGSSSYQEVYIARFNSSVLAGDCGAMVYTSVGKQCVGHVVTGSASSTGRTAFVIPVKHARQDIFRRLDMLYRTKALQPADNSHMLEAGRIHHNARPSPRPPPFNDSGISLFSSSWAEISDPGYSRNPPETSSRPHPLSPTSSLDIDSANPAAIGIPQDGKSLGDPHAIPLLPVVTNGQLFYEDESAFRTAVGIDIHGIINKSFFLSDGEWTCYRRSYFSCICSFSLTPFYLPNSSVLMHYVPNASPTSYKVFGFAVSISAVVASDLDSEPIGLVQHTPKRDKGPTHGPEKVRLHPKVLTARPMDENPYGVASEGPFLVEHIFERIQFRQATANNGKRRAAQQYYQLVVDLYADVGNQSADQWMKVAERKSAKLIVRGRSPGHYQAERRGSVSGNLVESRIRDDPRGYQYYPSTIYEDYTEKQDVVMERANSKIRNQNSDLS